MESDIFKRFALLKEEIKELFETKKKFIVHISKHDGSFKVKEIEYWAFTSILYLEAPLMLKVVIRRIGNGKLMFWSVMSMKRRITDGMDDL